MDIILRGGHIIDGLGNEALRRDVGVNGDTIVAIGNLGAAQAARIIDVSGLVVAPGFIDMHSHSDFTFPLDRTADSKIRQGITTEVVGQCGISLAPIAGDRREAFQRYVSFLLSSFSLDIGEYALNWSSFEEYLENLDHGGLAVNVIPLVGHGILRLAIMGMRLGTPTEKEMLLMRGLLANCLEDGAWGMSTGLIYPPGIYSNTQELISLAKVVAEKGGIYFTHIRGEGEKMPLLPALEEAIRIGRVANVPVQISHFKQAGKSTWPKASQALDLVNRARDEKLDVTADIYPYCAGSTLLAAMLLPSWAHSGDPSKPFVPLLDRELRHRLRQEIEVGVVASGARWEDFHIALYSVRPEFEGQTIQQVAQQTGQEPVDTALDMLVDSQGRILVNATLMHEENVQLGLSHPAMMVGSDGDARKPFGQLGVGKMHPRSYGTFPRVLGHYARDLGILTLVQAVQKMTSLPAQKLGIRDRGKLSVGSKADIAVFNPETVIDTATYPNPYRYPTGIEYVLVNGQTVVEGGERVDRFPGKVLQK